MSSRGSKTWRLKAYWSYGLGHYRFLKMIFSIRTSPDKPATTAPDILLEPDRIPVDCDTEALLDLVKLYAVIRQSF